MVGWKEAGVALMKKTKKNKQKQTKKNKTTPPKQTNKQKTECRCFRKLKTDLAYDIVILLLNICPKEMNLACHKLSVASSPLHCLQ